MMCMHLLKILEREVVIKLGVASIGDQIIEGNEKRENES